jgi:preprotein translocase subunit SecD
VEPAATSYVSRTTVILLVAAAAAALVVLIVSASLLLSAGDDSDGEPSPGVRYDLELRRVMTSEAGNCDSASPGQAIFCDGAGMRYTLGPPELDGDQVESVSAQESSYDDGQWLVRVTLDDDGTATFARLTTELTETQKNDMKRLIAVVADGRVVTAPQVTSPITEGKIDITGAFTKSDAEALVERMTN